jgi:hypothetical protein
MGLVLAGALTGGLFGGSGASSEAIARAVIDAVVKMTTSFSQDCVIQNSQIVSCDFSIEGGEGDVVFRNDMRQYLTVDSTCMQTSKTSNDINSKMRQQINQLVRSIAQQFQLGASTSKALIEATANLGIQVQNAFVQNCNGVGSQVITCTFSVDQRKGSVNAYNNIEQWNNSAFSCVAKNSAVNSAAVDISQVLSQDVSATVENTLAGIIGAIVAVLAVIGLIIFVVLFFRRGSTTPTTINAAPTQKQLKPSKAAIAKGKTLGGSSGAAILAAQYV